MTAYRDFLAAKAQLDGDYGQDPPWLPDFLFDFQRDLVEWAVRKGRGGIFSDCGTGKTPMMLVWAENVRKVTGKPVLIVTPLAVGFQTVAEAEKFGINAGISRDGAVADGITVTNYERLHLFDQADYGGVVCDESSAIKSFDGERRALVAEFLRQHRYRLLCTATAAPNDYIELGTSSEALGYLGYMDMLSRFFTQKPLTGAAAQRGWGHAMRDSYRFKGHAEEPFWKWVASWARAMRRPSDLGFSDEGFTLPPLERRTHVIAAREPAPGLLFDQPAVGLREERAELRRTLTERCEMAAKLVEPHDVSVVWCHLNDEGALLERLIPHSIQVRGADSDEFKEAAARWFTGDLCVCDHPLFQRKLAAWDGSRNTTTTAGPATKRTQNTEIGGKHKDEAPKPTANTCDATTKRTKRSSGSTSEPTRTGETNSGGNATPPTPNTEQRRSQKSSGGRKKTPTSGSTSDSSPSASPQTNTTKSSHPKVGGAPSVDEPRLEPGASTLTTATKQGASEGSSARNAILRSGSSETIPNDSNEQPCTCGQRGGRRRLITKPVMLGLGMNFQHCSHVVYFPSHSYEQYYQAVRRCWRFGQTNPVTVDVVTTEGGELTLANLERKAAQADRMFDALVAHMRDAVAVDRSQVYDHDVTLPTWIGASA